MTKGQIIDLAEKLELNLSYPATLEEMTKELTEGLKYQEQFEELTKEELIFLFKEAMRNKPEPVVEVVQEEVVEETTEEANNEQTTTEKVEEEVVVEKTKAEKVKETINKTRKKIKVIKLDWKGKRFFSKLEKNLKQLSEDDRISIIELYKEQYSEERGDFLLRYTPKTLSALILREFGIN